MKIPYKTYTNEKNEWDRVQSDQIDWCCDQLRRTFGNQIVYDPDPDGDDAELFIGFWQPQRVGHDASDRVPISYCPFCGSEIVIECLGTFKKVTEEVRVE